MMVVWPGTERVPIYTLMRFGGSALFSTAALFLNHVSESAMFKTIFISGTLGFLTWHPHRAIADRLLNISAGLLTGALIVKTAQFVDGAFKGKGLQSLPPLPLAAEKSTSPLCHWIRGINSPKCKR